jgi:3-oxoacid CoA-transferase subunit A
VGTLVAEGKETRDFDGKHLRDGTFAGARGVAGQGLEGRRSGNLVFRRTARNFNPAVIMAGRISVVEVEEIVDTGSFDPDAVHLPGIYVHRLVLNATPRSASRSAPPEQKKGA